MPGVIIDCRSVLHERVYVRYGHQDLDLIVRNGLCNGKLVQV
jgi:hypothetical protein